MPDQVPAICGTLLGGGGQGIVGEIDVFEVGPHIQGEIMRLRDSVP